MTVRARDRADDPRAVTVVLGVVGGVDVALDVRGGIGEGDVPLDAAGLDPAGAAGGSAAEPGVARPVGRADVQAAARADHPHRHVWAEAAVRAAGGELELFRRADALELIPGPGGGLVH